VADDFAPIPYQGEYTEDDLELFGEYEVLYPIVVEGRRFYVPAEISLLRACQFLEIKHRAVRMPWGQYCWNNTTGCCESTIKRGEAIEQVRACQTRVKPGLEVLKLPKGGRLCKTSA
jgi:hypothetical protein